MKATNTTIRLIERSTPMVLFLAAGVTGIIGAFTGTETACIVLGVTGLISQSLNLLLSKRVHIVRSANSEVSDDEIVSDVVEDDIPVAEYENLVPVSDREAEYTQFLKDIKDELSLSKEDTNEGNSDEQGRETNP